MPETILIVDDDAELRRGFVRALEAAGYRCIDCGHPERARKQFADNAIDLAIIDLWLPEHDGVQLAAWLRSRTQDRFLPIMMITGQGDTEVRVRAFEAGVDEFLDKPVATEELTARVHGLIGRRREHEQLSRTNDYLKDAQDKKRTLAALLVHDLRNPLSALLGNVDLLQEELVSADEFVKEIVDDCRALAEKSLHMVADILDVEELECGSISPKLDELRLGDIMRSPLLGAQTAIRARQLDFDLVCDDELIVSWDRDLMLRVVENLYDNAVRYARHQGRVCARARKERECVVLTVGNDGPTIEAKERDKIFERYYRTEGRRADARPNRGMGLYFCKLAVEAHGGTIRVADDDIGSVLRVELPQVGLSIAEQRGG